MLKVNSENNTTYAVLLAVLAAALYGVSSPISKVLLNEIPPTLLAALLYLGAGTGMLFVNLVKAFSASEPAEAKLTKQQLPYITGMIILDIAAPILLMFGLTLTTAETVSLLNNFEIVATTMIALIFFNEAIGQRMWLAIALITFSSVILSVEDFSRLSFSLGSILVLGACFCWGLENNCTRMLSLKDPRQIVVIKGLGSGIGSLLIALALKQYNLNLSYIIFALILGFVAYGLSIFFYIKAQRELGAARTSAYYAAAPFIGVLVSWLVLREQITSSFMIALAIMLLGTYLAITESHGHHHIHKEVSHEHRHTHGDGHHDHQHDMEISEHSHQHTHDVVEHEHPHLPDLHHRHDHKTS